MTDLMTLGDEEIFKRAQKLRLLATSGDKAAASRAAAYVGEARRRFADAQTLTPGLESKLPASKRAWWRFW
jgi:hypothetical protein